MHNEQIQAEELARIDAQNQLYYAKQAAKIAKDNANARNRVADELARVNNNLDWQYRQNYWN